MATINMTSTHNININLAGSMIKQIKNYNYNNFYYFLRTNDIYCTINTSFNIPPFNQYYLKTLNYNKIIYNIQNYININSIINTNFNIFSNVNKIFNYNYNKFHYFLRTNDIYCTINTRFDNYFYQYYIKHNMYYKLNYYLIFKAKVSKILSDIYSIF